MDITESFDATGLSQAIHAKQISCREVMQATLTRIDALNPKFNAIVSLRDANALLAEADAHDALLARGQSRGWLHGIPQAIKDLSATAGIATTLGSPLLQNFVPKEDGLMVQRIRGAGAIVIGKTNTPEFGLGSHTFNEVFGTTRNAYDPTRSAGGSSGGAAVALALRLVAVADGSDFMGSLRNPAGWNHIFGLRPSQGRVPMWPAQDVWTAQLGTEGPMARTVRDLARMLDTQAGYDPRVPLSLDDGARFAEGLGGLDARTVRIGWLGDLGGYLPMESGILDVCQQALKTLQSLGCAVEPTALGTPPEPVWDAWLVWRRALVAARIAPFVVQPANRAKIKPEALWEHDQAASLTGAQFAAASARRSAFYQHLLTLFAHHDFLALPVAQVWPFDASLRWPAEIAGRTMDTYHRWMEVVIYATFAGLPAISVPAGFDTRGLPMGLQLIGRPRDDAGLLRLAALYEAAVQPLLQRRPGTA
ncbi:amidase [Pseudorhodoferax sp. Leaf267]|uniref:amidase n=1 Tax=Pseudorhodoferax sp. Leaf267 TaxID=1736316 RepID=UPI0006F4C946|nr:amidase [Pseudorhodoferax sp. Leaf267]KQP12631.1 amidase [Pseudorhodoferax sp. Leaf267]